MAWRSCVAQSNISIIKQHGWMVWIGVNENVRKINERFMAASHKSKSTYNKTILQKPPKCDDMRAATRVDKKKKAKRIGQIFVSLFDTVQRRFA